MGKDFYTKKARQEGYSARSAYKLKQINKKYRLIKEGDNVLDLGCWPGGWSQVASQIIGPKGSVTGVDVKEIKIRIRNFEQAKADVNQFHTEKIFKVVISDTAPRTSGAKELDHEISISLARRALSIAKTNLIANGNFLCKVFQGRYFKKLLDDIKRSFKFVKPVKPEASKKESKEIYIIGIGKLP